MRKLLILLVAAPLFASDARMEILVNGAPRPEYQARGTVYIEAVKGQGYEIRLTNPYGVRAAVALSIDGLNTLDAKHTDARSARKWVLEPYQTIVLRGWQTSNQESRRFFFTNEQKSYGQWLGETDNLGVISAAFFRERVPEYMTGQLQASPRAAAREMAPPAMLDRKEKSAAKDLAATGIGEAEQHIVTRVSLDLEDTPASVVSIRYEYHAALVSLGVIPRQSPVNDALRRREEARGFVDNGYCPAPPR